MIGRRVCSRCGDVYQENRFGRPVNVCAPCVESIFQRPFSGFAEATPSGFPWPVIIPLALLVGAAWLAGER